MSHVDCPACGEAVPVATASCPRCGHRFQHEKVFSLTDPLSVFSVLAITLTVLGLLTLLIGVLFWPR